MSNTLKFGNGEWYGKEGTILAYNSENNNYKPLPFNFERDSVATRVNKQGLIETVGADQPRVDYLNDSNGALLLEPSRTNLILNSQRISLSPTQNGTFTDNFAISPDGTQNATKLTATDTDPFFYQSVSFSAGSYTASIYVKGIGNSVGKDFQIRLGGSGSAQIEIPSEWTRIEYTATMTSGSANCGIEIPNPSVIGDEVLVWGWQIEAGSYATSYIPTQGGSVTRVADFCSQTPPDGVIGQTEGVVYCNFKINNNPTSTRRVVIMSNGTGNERIGISLGNNILYAFIVDGGSTQCEIVKSSITSGNYKCAFAYNNNDFVFYVNGSQVGTDTNGTVATCDTIEVGNQFGTSVLEGSINDIKLYNTRLSNSELAALTQV